MLTHCSSRVLDGLASVTLLRLQSYGELVTGGEVELVAGGDVELVAGGELGLVGGGGGGGILKSKMQWAPWLALWLPDCCGGL